MREQFRHFRFFRRSCMLLLVVLLTGAPGLPVSSVLAQADDSGPSDKPDRPTRNPREKPGDCPPPGGPRRSEHKPPGGFSHHTPDLAQIALLPAVRKELKLTDDQQTKLKKAYSKIKKMRSNVDWSGLDRQQRRTRFEELRGEQRQLIVAKLEDVLDADQFKRAKQIRWHLIGAPALFDKEISDHLAITEEQKASIQTLMHDSMHKAMRDYFDSDKSVSMRESMRNAKAAINKLVIEQLEPGQRTKFKELKGEPFEIKFDESKRRRGRPDDRGRRPDHPKPRKPEGDRQR